MKYLKVLVTGATGFVGSHLVEELVKSETNVIATTHHKILPHSYFATQKLEKKSEVIQIDVCQFGKLVKLVKYFNPDYIFHLAAQPLVEEAFKDPKTTLYANILGTINILECVKLSKNIKAVIIASSDKAYGKLSFCHSDQVPIRSGRVEESLAHASSNKSRDPSTSLGMTPCVKYLESDPLRGDHPYEVSKSSADLISQAYYKTYGLPVVVTRFGNIYGEGDLHFSRLIPGIMKALANHEIFKIRSNGKYVRDYLYVKDVVRGYLMLAKNINKVKGEAYNFGSNDTYSVIGLIRLISQICQIPLKYRVLNTAQNEIPYQSLDFSKIRKTLGWKPEYTIAKTIKRVFHWYRSSLK